MSLPSHAGGSAAEATLVVARCHYQVMLAMVCCHRRVDGVDEATLAVDNLWSNLVCHAVISLLKKATKPMPW
jgi:hypothetical protein